MNSADFLFYTGSYWGNILKEADFNRLIVHSAAYIDSITFGKIPKDDELNALKLAQCAVCEALFSAERKSGVKSESVGKYSVTYMEDGKKSASLKGELREAAERFLLAGGLLYRGC